MISSIEILRAQPGFKSSKCFKDQEDKNRLLVIEEWESKTYHDQFVQGMPAEDMEKWTNLSSKPPSQKVYGLASQS